MASWSEILMNVMKLSDTVAALNHDVEKLDSVLRDVDKRVVRLETALEFSNPSTITRVIEPTKKD